MIHFQCTLCRTKLSAADEAAGQQMRCGNCLSIVTVPTPEPASVAAGSAEDVAIKTPPAAAVPAKSSPAPPARSAVKRPPPTQYGKRYGFNCVYCSSRLEATETMAGHEGQCPTCGNSIVIPILDRYGRLIDPVTQQVIKQDPHPVHAYAAAGERAPRIVRTDEGVQQIVCAKCKRPSPIAANNCKHCGMPFTMEGTAPESVGGGGFATASLVLGVIGMPFGCTMIVPLLAVIFGGIALAKPPADGAGRGQAIAGVVCGLIGLGVGVAVYLR